MSQVEPSSVLPHGETDRRCLWSEPLPAPWRPLPFGRAQGQFSGYIVQHFENVCYHVRLADTLGFHAAIFLTGHYGPNWEDLKTLLGLLQPHVGTRLYGLPDFEANQPGFAGDGKNTGDHAGRVETSLLWAVSECTMAASTAG